MDAVEFFKTVNRLCKNRDCNLYPVQKEGRCMIGFDDISIKSIEETISKVEQWAKEHPIKTRQSEFLKMFPKAEIVNIERTFCVAHFDITKKCKEISPSYEQCVACKYKFWNDEVTDND